NLLLRVGARIARIGFQRGNGALDDGIRAANALGETLVGQCVSPRLAKGLDIESARMADLLGLRFLIRSTAHDAERNEIVLPAFAGVMLISVERWWISVTAQTGVESPAAAKLTGGET